MTVPRGLTDDDGLDLVDRPAIRLGGGAIRAVSDGVHFVDGLGSYTKVATHDATVHKVDGTLATTGGVCERTRAVQEAIVAAVDGAAHCAEVTAAELRGITRLPAGHLSEIASPAFGRGDFAGMPGLEGLSLSVLEAETLPGGVFDGLTGLREIFIDSAGGNLTRLPRGLFAGLSSLERIVLLLKSEAEDPAGGAVRRSSPAGNH